MSRLADAQAQARAEVQAGDPDRYIATLFAPERLRAPLFALYAFDLETTRIRRKVSEPLPGEVRLQWWRDTLEQARFESGHPIAFALGDAIQRYNLPIEALVGLIEARIFDLYDDLMPGWNDLDGYLGETDAVIIRLASFILAGGTDPGEADACGHAGVAIGMTRILKLFPSNARLGQVFLPEEALNAFNLRRVDILSGNGSEKLSSIFDQFRTRIRNHLAALERSPTVVQSELRPAFLPLATVPITLRASERHRDRVFEPLAPIPQWRRILAMLRWRL